MQRSLDSIEKIGMDWGAKWHNAQFITNVNKREEAERAVWMEKRPL